MNNLKISVLLLFLLFEIMRLNGQSALKFFVGSDSATINKEKDMGSGRISNITSPAIYAFFPNETKRSSIAVLICPGGGYALESFKYEGSELAEWLSENGITAFVLKYRLPNGNPRLPLEDAQAAMTYIRKNSKIWKIDPQKIGVIGFSAGGHLAASLLTHGGKESMPDFGILFYPVITMQDSLTHKGSKKNLLGNNIRDTKLIDYYSCEQNVTKNTPPVLLILSDDDKTVSTLNSILFYSALKKNDIAASLNILPKGGHGWGFDKSFCYFELIKTLLLNWLCEMNT